MHVYGVAPNPDGVLAGETENVRCANHEYTNFSSSDFTSSSLLIIIMLEENLCILECPTTVQG
jgi:hypothetical protein